MAINRHYIRREVVVEIEDEIITMELDFPADMDIEECQEFAVAYVYDTIHISVTEDEDDIEGIY